MSKQDRGEHSRSDQLSEHEKPLKKARFLWEVKGKHHLKESHVPYENISQSNNVEELNRLESNCSSAKKKLCFKSRHVDKGEKTELCNCVQQFLSKSEDIMDNIEDELNSNQVDDEEDNIPSSLLEPQDKDTDYYLRKWQARQIARGFVDNTINSVLETWTTRPPDASDLVENCRNDGQVEDDAIMMAIQEHGLQSRSESRGDSRLHFSSELQEQMATILVKETADRFPIADQGINDYVQTEENLDFINAAVSAAIERKGLSYGF